MAPLLNVPVSHLGEMAFVTVTPDEMDVFLLCSTLCFPILLTNRRAVGTVSSKEMSRNEGAGLLYCQSSIHSRMFSVFFFFLILIIIIIILFLFNNRD